MYADRVEAETRRSIKDRLNGNFRDDSSRRRQITGKRQRQDDKWEHDLYQDGEPQVSNHKVDARDLRLKLQRKSQQASESGRGSQSGVRDLREKLSGTMHPQPMNYDPPKPTPEASKPARKSVAVQASTLESKKASSTVDDFLQSLGLEKYSITFQAEEVDMTALAHMTDEDLKAIGIPMLIHHDGEKIKTKSKSLMKADPNGKLCRVASSKHLDLGMVNNRKPGGKAEGGGGVLGEAQPETMDTRISAVEERIE
ncbi:hypothetical protein L484_007030 [Morus notabilis]|uniref:SAM domain-containing protein n=1 Tax=Morus notabilis TaxID=981085 RepID=W9RW23_9ROSA|nr:hypothetical protein L484_007030 [Morus notabilis]